jgi:hypothetical protein
MTELDDRLRHDFHAVRERVERLPLPDITNREPREAKRPRALAVLSAALVVLLVAGVAVIAGHSQTPNRVPTTPPSTSNPNVINVRVATDSRRAVRGAHLIRRLLFDGRTLQLDVARGASRVDEAHAIALFRAGSLPWTIVENVTVVYADATLRLPVETGGVIRPRVIPAFQHRPVWAFIFSNGPHSCPAEPVTKTGAVALPEPQQVELIAADGSGEGVSYQTRGATCWGPIIAPQAEVASYYVSLPWTASSITSAGGIARYHAPPACGDIEYTPTSRTAAGTTFGVYASVLMARPPCKTPPQPTSTGLPGTAGVALVHDPTGLSRSRFTTPAMHFTYFDGRSHTTT